MNRELKRVSRILLLMFVALFVSTSLIQVVYSDQLRADPRNVRTLYDSYSAERGAILVDGQPIAYSTPVDDVYKYQRVYPQGPLYAPVTGYFTLNQGNTGLEGALNQELSGTANSQFLQSLISLITGDSPSGASVETTIDPAVQQVAWDALGSLQGAVIAIEPATGRILAMVSTPSYDPNLFANHNTSEVIAAYKALTADPKKPLDNRTIGGNLNPPGSTFKLVVSSAALESGKYTAASEFANPPSYVLPGTSTSISNSEGGLCGGAPTVSIADALRLSCNIPFAQLGLALGEPAIREQAEKYGFNKSMEIPLKVTPSVYPEGMDQAQLALSSFGQYDVRATPIQMAMVSAAIANGGDLMKPNLVDQIISPNLTVLQQFSPERYSQPISSQTAQEMTKLMVANVSNGAASNARIDGVSVAGKTGTAQNGKDDPYTLWFTGFAPADNPQVAVAVLVEDGGGLGQSGYGNLLAAPIAKKVFEAVLSR